jgi:hypothetical protein
VQLGRGWFARGSNDVMISKGRCPSKGVIL